MKKGFFITKKIIKLKMIMYQIISIHLIQVFRIILESKSKITLFIGSLILFPISLIGFNIFFVHEFKIRLFFSNTFLFTQAIIVFELIFLLSIVFIVLLVLSELRLTYLSSLLFIEYLIYF
jgi:hypothetical protein